MRTIQTDLALYS